MTVVGKPKLMRKINRELLVSTLREKQYLTNKELTRITGLSRRTVNLIIESLKEIGIVAEAGYGDSTDEGGKRPVIYKFIPDSFFAIGIMVGDLKAVIGIANLNGQILFEEDALLEWDKGKEHVSKQILSLVQRSITRSKIDIAKFLGIGIGLPGIIDSKKGIIKTLTRHKGWENYALVDSLKKELELEIEIRNENHVRVLGEKWFGLAKNSKNFVTVITTHDGIGAGVVINNKLISSNNCLLGEVGHIKVNKNKINYEGLMDFEYYLGLKHIEEIIEDNNKLGSYSDSPIRKIKDSGKRLTLNDLFNSYNSDDEFSRVIVEKISKYLILLINTIVCTYDPELIIIQGKYSLLKDEYYREVASIIEGSLYPQVKKKIIIKRSTRTREMSILGSAGIVFDKVSI